MSVLSKLLGPHLLILPHNCYELAHTWTPFCSTSGLTIFQSSAKESFKVYSTLYIIATLLKRPNFKDLDYARLFKDILRSTAFLTSNAFFFITSLCFLRRVLGFFILPTFFFNGLIASFISILIERKSRRGMLALYLTNLASEVSFRMLFHRNIVRPIKYGEVLIFSIVISGYFYMFKSQNLNDYASGALKSIFAIRQPGAVGVEEKKFSNLPFRFFPKFLLKFLTNLRRLSIKSDICSHSNSCLSVSVEGFLQNFVLAFFGTSVLKIISDLPSLVKRPVQFFKHFFNKKSFGLPLFLGFLPLVYHSSSCLLRRISGKDSTAVHSIAGFLAGLSMYFYPSVSVSLYLLWKLIENFYFKGVAKGWFPHFPNADIAIYSLSTAFVLFAAIMEPHALRPGYWKFLMNLTGTNFARVNRPVLDAYGMHSSKAFPNFKPNLNPKYLSMNPIFMKR